MYALGMHLVQLYLNPTDKLIGIIGEAGSGKSALIRHGQPPPSLFRRFPHNAEKPVAKICRLRYNGIRFKQQTKVDNKGGRWMTKIIRSASAGTLESRGGRASISSCLPLPSPGHGGLHPGPEHTVEGPLVHHVELGLLHAALGKGLPDRALDGVSELLLDHGLQPYKTRLRR